MPGLIHGLEAVAARGAEGLTAEARAAVSAALLARLCPEGGFAGLDGRADPYFSLFAWLSLRAVRAAYDAERLCAYMEAHLCDSNKADSDCAQLLLSVERLEVGMAWRRGLAALCLGGSRGAYSAFLSVLAAGDVPRWLIRLAWLRQRRLFDPELAERMATPRLAAGLVLAALAGGGAGGLESALKARRCSTGGFVSSAGAPPDLLATAVARFAIGIQRDAKLGACEADLAFVECCWLEDGLFGASPAALAGDAEHTFYGLLALGTCR